MNLIRRILTVVALVSLACFAANAGVISYTTSFPNTYTDYSHTLALLQWNPALFSGQTLTSAEVVFTATQDLGATTLTNISSSAQTFKIDITSDVLTSGVAGLLPIDIPLSLFHSGFITLGIGAPPAGWCPANTPNSACNAVTYTAIAPVTGTADTGVLTGSILSSFYSGTGTFNLTGQTATGTTFTGGGGNIQLATNSVALMSATVTYNYSSVPEPTTMAMLGPALIGLGLIGRKRFAR